MTQKHLQFVAVPQAHTFVAVGASANGPGLGYSAFSHKGSAKMPDLLNHPIAFKDIEYQFATSGVYAIYCAHSDTYYIGQAVVVLRRLVDHFTQLRDGRHQNDILQREFTMFGEESYIVDLLVDMPRANQFELKVQETKEIQRFKAHGKRLYNKVVMPVKLHQTKSPPRNSKSTNGGGAGARVMTHTERVSEKVPTAATCYDCGTTGVLVADVFECDDGLNRCTDCIEKHLDGWQLDFGQERPGAPASRGSGKTYWRWQVPVGASVHEHIVLAAKRFHKKFGYMPSTVYVAPDLEAPDEYRGIEVIKGGIAVRRFIDIAIE